MLKHAIYSNKWLLSLIMVAALGRVAFCQAISVQSAAQLTAKDSAKTETSIGDLFADAIRSAAKTDAAFVAAGDLRTNDLAIPAGIVAAADISAFASYPDDVIAEVSLTGKVLKQALEKSVSIYPQPSQGFLQVSGLTFTVNPARKPGERITDVKIGSSTVADAAVYKIGMTSSLANGALGYWKTWSKDDISRRLGGVTVVDAVNGFLKANSKINYGKLERIRTAR